MKFSGKDFTTLSEFSRSFVGENKKSSSPIRKTRKNFTSCVKKRKIKRRLHAWRRIVISLPQREEKHSLCRSLFCLFASVALWLWCWLHNVAVAFYDRMIYNRARRSDKAETWSFHSVGRSHHRTATEWTSRSCHDCFTRRTPPRRQGYIISPWYVYDDIASETRKLFSSATMREDVCDELWLWFLLGDSSSSPSLSGGAC